jgi:hypothetical protein
MTVQVLRPVSLSDGADRFLQSFRWYRRQSEAVPVLVNEEPSNENVWGGVVTAPRV